MTKYAAALALSVAALAGMNAPAFAGRYISKQTSCPDCAPSKKYDDVKVIKTNRDVRHVAKVINTYSVETVYVRPVLVTVNFKVQKYRIVEGPALLERVRFPVAEPQSCRSSRRTTRYGACGPVLRVRG